MCRLDQLNARIRVTVSSFPIRFFSAACTAARDFTCTWYSRPVRVVFTLLGDIGGLGLLGSSSFQFAALHDSITFTASTQILKTKKIL